MKSVAYLFAAALMTVAGAAQAQTSALAGQWGCTWGVRDTSPRQRPAVMQEFQMMVQNDGRAYGEGVVSSSSGSYPFQFEGTWQMSGNEFVVQGRQNSMIGPQPFFFSSVVFSASQMSFNELVADGNIIASACQR